MKEGGEQQTVNDHNLIPAAHKLTVEEQSNGGKASAAARRRKKSMKQKLQLLLSLPPCDNDKEQLDALGVEEEDTDNEMVLLTALFLKAAAGDVQAFREIRSILGKDIAAAELELKRQELKLKKDAAIRDTPSAAAETPLLYQALGADDT